MDNSYVTYILHLSVANTRLNETMEVVRDVKCHHVECGDLLVRLYRLTLTILTLNLQLEDFPAETMDGEDKKPWESNSNRQLHLYKATNKQPTSASIFNSLHRKTSLMLLKLRGF